jgi:hypothetical protein
MPKLLLKKMVGLNASKAKLQLQPGEMGNYQNVRSRPFDNWVKRSGIEAVSSQDSPINGIFELELDNITIPIIQSGDTLVFYPDLASENGSFNNPSSDQAVFGVTDPLDPNNSHTAIFNIEQTMRAIQDRRVVAGHSAFSWPNLIFAQDGTLLNGNTGIAVSSYPANNLYGPDLAYHDIYYGNPAGTRAAALINQIISCCRDTVDLNDWLDTTTGLENHSSVTLLTSVIFPALGSATRGNYQSKLNSCKVGIRDLIAIRRSPTQTSAESKSGEAQTSNCGSYGNCYKITGYTSTTFNDTSPTTCGGTTPRCVGSVTPCSSCTEWDGSFTCVSGSVHPFEQWTPNGGTPATFSMGSNCIFIDSGNSNSCQMYNDGGSGWVLTIYLYHATFTGSCYNIANSSSVTYSKATGTDPTGVYSRDSQFQATGPASITIAAC